MPGSTPSESAILELEKEAKIEDLLAGEGIERYEASGVCAKGNRFYVIFDNLPHIARLDPSLKAGHRTHRLVLQRGASPGFEDITFNDRERRFLVIIEARQDDGGFRPSIEEYDEDLRYLGTGRVNFVIESENKGMEGLAYVHRGDEDYALALCEGNRCKGGKKGREPGGGRLQILQKENGAWARRGTIKLPKSLPFEDYAGVDVDGSRIAVVSQASAALWIGTFRDDGWDLVDEGTVYRFPVDDAGGQIYYNIEGVAWLAPNRLATVSDRRKKGDQPKIAKVKDQSVHIFRIPDGE